eukprot:TRINITY_DN36273_c3_g1_i1.p1 TRINITY_DN36273_c3_g1~~TRINITY_DN36273_c3_g1_i1.p1  ORF type:complete len:111 (-),score=13.36 TRINITY_DN36273_c3_g1_i1:44-376(-)
MHGKRWVSHVNILRGEGQEFLLVILCLPNPSKKKLQDGSPHFSYFFNLVKETLSFSMQANNIASKEKFLLQVDGPPRKRGRPKKTRMELVRIYLKKCNLSEDLAQDRLKW